MIWTSPSRFNIALELGVRNLVTRWAAAMILLRASPSHLAGIRSSDFRRKSGGFIADCLPVPLKNLRVRELRFAEHV